MRRCFGLFFLLPLGSYAQPMYKAADSVRLTRTIPGLVYAVFTSDSIVETGACGNRKFRTRNKVTVDDHFNIGTNTAAFTSYLAAKLVERGKIKWSTKISDVYPEFKKKMLPVYRNIDLLALLSNQTRLPPFAELEDWSTIPSAKGDIVARRKAFTYFILNQRPNMDNWDLKKTVFSVAGYTVAASLLERVSGKSWEKLIDEYIAKPLHIAIHYSWPDLSDTLGNTGHWSRYNYFHAEDHDSYLRINAVLFPAHDINISLMGYIRFMQENLRGLLGKKAGLKQSSFQFIHFGIPDYSLGWNNGVMDSYSYCFQEGTSILFNCRVSLLKEKDIGFIVMCNSADRYGRAGDLNLARILEDYYLHH